MANVQAHVGGELAARAATNIDDVQLRELKEIQAQLEEAYAGGDNERTVRLNHEFHRAINVAAESPKLAQLMSQITRYAPESVFPTIAGWPHQSIKKTIAGWWRRWPNTTASLPAKPCRNTWPPVQLRLIDHLTEHGVVESGDGWSRGRRG